MLRTKYRQEMDNMIPRSGFEEETVALLERVMSSQHKEEKIMFMSNKRIRIGLIAAAAAFLLTSVVFAAAALLRPDEVADTFGETAIADAFRSEGSIVINQSKQSNGYTFTLMGIVSGEHLESIRTDAGSRSYLVLSIEHTDGTPFAIEDDCPVTVTPLIDGYDPRQQNLYSLDTYRMDTTANGIRYCLISTDALEAFSGCRIRIAVFDGIFPGEDVFTMRGDGVIGYSDGYTGTKAMFDLPLNPEKADPAAAAALIEH